MLGDILIRRILGKVEIKTIEKRLKGKPLTQIERNYLSRSIRPKLRAAMLLSEQKILEKLQPPDRLLEDKILYNLSYFGYPMISKKRIKKHNKIPIEELIAIIICQMPKPRFIEAIPILLLKNNIDKYKLAEIIYKYRIQNQMGYLLETAIILSRKFECENDFTDLMDYLKKNKQTEYYNLSEIRDEIYQKFIEKTTPKRMKKWRLFGRFFDQDFIENAEAYL